MYHSAISEYHAKLIYRNGPVNEAGTICWRFQINRTHTHRTHGFSVHVSLVRTFVLVRTIMSSWSETL
jgi:hypothetical protein